MQQFCIINSKGLIATTCMAIKPEQKTKNNYQQKVLITKFTLCTIKQKLSASIPLQKTYDIVRPKCGDCSNI